jgi:hypothetical protein
VGSGLMRTGRASVPARRGPFVAASLILGAVLAATGSPASEFPPLDIDELIDRTRVIARIEIVERRTRRYRHGEKELSCGYAYRARVHEELKGVGAREITFWTADNLELSTGEQYLVLLYESGLDSWQTQLLSRRSLDEERQSLCLRLGADLGVGYPPAVSRFDPKLENETGQRWFEAEEWIVDIPNSVEKRWMTREDPLRRVVSWADFSRFVTERLKRAAEKTGKN